MLRRDEIGSEFWNVPITDRTNHLFPASIQWYISGRSALQAIIKELKGVRTVAMPSWCCHTMIKPFIDSGIAVSFYPVYYDKKSKRLQQEIDTSCDALFLMDYFGYTGETEQKLLCKSSSTIVIRDVTHSIFSYSYNDANYYFGSLRKWCGMWTGGYAWAEDGHSLFPGDKDNQEDGGFTQLRKKAMELKNRYMHDWGRNGDISENKGYLSYYNQAERKLDNCGILSASDRDVRLAHNLDIALIKKKRRANAKILMEAFSDWLIFPELRQNNCPLSVPILVPNGKRDDVKKRLIGQKIYCPVHWPISEYHRLDEVWMDSKELYHSELSLVCDQRYDKGDMDRLVDTLQICLRENRKC